MSFQGKIVLKKKTFELPSVPIGIDSPIVVPIPLMNIGSNQASYHLDLIDFQNNYSNYIRDNIISFKNESGQLQPGEKQNLLVLFKPVSQEKVILSVNLHIKDFFKEIEVLKINLFGQGTMSFSHIQMNKFFKIEDHMEDCDRENTTCEKEQAYFSSKLLDFRNIDMSRSHFRLIIIYNNSESQLINFEIENLVYFR